MSSAAPQAATDPLDDFVAMSAILTGIAADKLHPSLDTFGTAQEYLDYATAHGGPAFPRLMSAYAAIRSQTPAQIGSALLAPSGSTEWMAKTVMLMWYLGAWFEPADLQTYQANPTPFPPDFVVISSNAYTQSWIWRVAQSHPMGYSTWRFGYWNAPPPPLNDFIAGS